uniref:PHD finger protein 13 n=1 Tax=Coturnix japonica TaxID=93934 RepID=A0A8C2TSI4_COTJA
MGWGGGSLLGLGVGGGCVGWGGGLSGSSWGGGSVCVCAWIRRGRGGGGLWCVWYLCVYLCVCVCVAGPWGRGPVCVCVGVRRERSRGGALCVSRLWERAGGAVGGLCACVWELGVSWGRPVCVYGGLCEFGGVGEGCVCARGPGGGGGGWEGSVLGEWVRRCRAGMGGCCRAAPGGDRAAPPCARSPRVPVSRSGGERSPAGGAGLGGPGAARERGRHLGSDQVSGTGRAGAGRGVRGGRSRSPLPLPAPCRDGDGAVLPLRHDDAWDLITCFCLKPFAGRPMIECSECATWIHLSCAKIRKSNVPEIFICQRCRDAKQEIRRSNRARTVPRKRFCD